jgi:NAD(P)H dehydrogenase (quinone)
MSAMLLITGASGRIGRRVAELVADKGHALRLMTRSPQRAPNIPRAEIVEGGFDDLLSMDAAFAGVTTALIVSGSGKPGDRARLHRRAFESASRAGVGHVIYLSLQGSAPESRYPYSRDHYVSEQYLAAAGLPYTVLRNSFYMDMLLEQFDVRGVVRGPADHARAAFVSREDVARTAAAVLVEPPGGIHNVTGPEALSVADGVQRLATLIGRPIRYDPESPKAARARLRRSIPEPWKVDLMVGWFGAIAAGEIEDVSDTVARCTGAPPLAFEEYFNRFPELVNRLRPSPA